MQMAPARLFLMLCLSMSITLPVSARTLTIAISSADTLPLAQIENEQLRSGILKDIGDAIGAYHQRKVVYLATPRKRLQEVMESHSADLLCGSNPLWLSGKFAWSLPILDNTGLLASNARVKKPKQLADLSGKAIGTISGYVYSEFSAAMGKQFIRDDAPNMTLNMRKFLFGRFDYVAVDELSYLYALKQEKPKLKLNEPLLTSHYQFYCAVSPQSTLSVAQVNKAVAALRNSGQLQAILRQYR